MSEKEIKRLTDLAKKKLKEGISKEDALHTFVLAGILNAQGNFTKPYKHLASAVAENS